MARQNLLAVPRWGGERAPGGVRSRRIRGTVVGSVVALSLTSGPGERADLPDGTGGESSHLPALYAYGNSAPGNPWGYATADRWVVSGLYDFSYGQRVWTRDQEQAQFRDYYLSLIRTSTANSAGYLQGMGNDLNDVQFDTGINKAHLAAIRASLETGAVVQHLAAIEVATEQIAEAAADTETAVTAGSAQLHGSIWGLAGAAVGILVLLALFKAWRP